MRRLVVIAVTVVATGVGLAGPAPATSEPGPGPYVALGDSFSAGSGILPLDPGAPLPCARTSLNYPHVIAERTGVELTDVTCGGAQTKHFAQSQYPGVAPQLDALDRGTGLVTMTIGGNDNNTFIGAILACGTAGLGTLGYGSPCKDTYGSRFTDAVRESTYPALVRALQAVQDEAPNAEVAILGYPWILPPTTGCFAKMPVARGDVPYLRNLQRVLNDAVERAAESTGATFVDLSRVSEGHDACQPHGTRWIEPLLFGTNVVPVHPNALGERRMAAETLSVLGM